MPNAYSHADAYVYAYTYANAYVYGYAYAYADAYAYDNADAYIDAYIIITIRVSMLRFITNSSSFSSLTL